MDRQVKEGRWSWVVVMTSFMSNILINGSYSMFGQFYPELMEAFEKSDTVTVAVFSVQCMAVYGSGQYTSIIAFREHSLNMERVCGWMYENSVDEIDSPPS
jgi:hypothetical protein